MKFAVTSFGWNFSQFFSRMDGKDDVFEWQLVIAKWHCLLLASSTAVARPVRLSAGASRCARFGASGLLLRCAVALSSTIHVHLQGSRHWQPTSRLQSSNAAPGSNVDLSPLSHVIWLNKQDWKCSIRARARWPAPPDDDSGHFLTLINSQNLAYKIKINYQI